MYTFGGHVRCANGNGIGGEQVLVRYVYTFEGVDPHEGRVYCTPDGPGGLFQFERDITNIWGSGELLSVVAWAWNRENERYIAEVVPTAPNFFDDFVYICGKPGDIWPEEGANNGSSGGAVAATDSIPASLQWGNIKALFR